MNESNEPGARFRAKVEALGREYGITVDEWTFRKLRSQFSTSGISLRTLVKIEAAEQSASTDKT